MRNFEVKVNKKARRAALRSALSDHAAHGSIAVVGADVVRRAVDEAGSRACSPRGGEDLPLLVIAHRTRRR